MSTQNYDVKTTVSEMYARNHVSIRDNIYIEHKICNELLLVKTFKPQCFWGNVKINNVHSYNELRRFNLPSDTFSYTVHNLNINKIMCDEIDYDNEKEKMTKMIEYCNNFQIMFYIDDFNDFLNVLFELNIDFYFNTPFEHSVYPLCLNDVTSIKPFLERYYKNIPKEQVIYYYHESNNNIFNGKKYHFKNVCARIEETEKSIKIIDNLPFTYDNLYIELSFEALNYESFYMLRRIMSEYKIMGLYAYFNCFRLGYFKTLKQLKDVLNENQDILSNIRFLNDNTSSTTGIIQCFEEYKTYDIAGMILDWVSDKSHWFDGKRGYTIKFVQNSRFLNNGIKREYYDFDE